MQALGEPGKQNIYVWLTTAPMARDWIVDVAILLKLSCRNSSPNPSIVLLAIAITASGVESLPVKPVPPVDIMTSIRGSFDRSRNVCLINSTSSLIINLFLTE